MDSNVIRVGQHDIRKLPNGMYSVSLNNGNIGAFMTDEAGLQEFLNKQGVSLERNPQTDQVSFSSGEDAATNPQETQKKSNTALKLLGAAAVAAGGYFFFKNTKIGRQAFDWIKGLFKKAPKNAVQTIGAEAQATAGNATKGAKSVAQITAGTVPEEVRAAQEIAKKYSDVLSGKVKDAKVLKQFLADVHPDRTKGLLDDVATAVSAYRSALTKGNTKDAAQALAYLRQVLANKQTATAFSAAA